MVFLESVQVQHQRRLLPDLCQPNGRTRIFWMRQASRTFEWQRDGPGGNRQACSSAEDTHSLSRRETKARDGQKTNSARPGDLTSSPEMHDCTGDWVTLLSSFLASLKGRAFLSSTWKKRTAWMDATVPRRRLNQITLPICKGMETFKYVSTSTRSQHKLGHGRSWTKWAELYSQRQWFTTCGLQTSRDPQRTSKGCRRVLLQATVLHRR
ncbi:uncharacterized protein LOC121064349 isoform X1 [Cygnus olor]|uniref:uncharacterized protein LOC121064349 isoform X1 n=1 Tax=Cygnus olor TaxID=8869 RepID=UPI001ADE7484|nr:uncharacterized protein LOC121064349 isoform X1 [Cygnus olor]XP_040401596.1 uncharacterized protein LOC121064349 isoform X1 [Cygnus olor]